MPGLVIGEEYGWKERDRLGTTRRTGEHNVLASSIGLDIDGSDRPMDIALTPNRHLKQPPDERIKDNNSSSSTKDLGVHSDKEIKYIVWGEAILEMYVTLDMGHANMEFDLHKEIKIARTILCSQLVEEETDVVGRHEQPDPNLQCERLDTDKGKTNEGTWGLPRLRN
ncbi:hypothetical protein Syun_007475 [Stephania yunnanensis]|uniref:Uncharacterized protein n=1 Tax=Stephania yunnanensis TaxID=152371 RepID=A0AAP0L0B0_9MAGN